MELLGVVAIIGILCALTAVGVVAYNRSLKVMELNNTAEEIYIAAQNHLTALRTNATAEKALKDAGYGTRASDVSSNAPADLTAADADDQWAAMYAFGMPTAGSAASGSTVSGGASSGTAGAAGSASGASGSTADLSGSAAGVSGGTALSYAQIAAYVLPAGAVDGTVAGEGNSYIVEYNPSTYTIYGVFYADGKSSVLGRDTGETISVSDLGALNKEVKADGSTKITSFKPQNGSGSTGICVGYYGGSSAAGVESHKLNGSLDLKIVNAERLYVELTVKNLALADETAAEQAGNTFRIVLDVKGKTSGAEKTIGHTVQYDGELDGTGSSWINLKEPEINRTASKAVYRIVLDDITRQGTHFAEIFGDGTSDNGINFIPGENITVSANAVAVGKLSNMINSSTTVGDNSLFGSLTADSSVADTVTENVTISNFRHLENLSPRVSHVMRMTGTSDADRAVSLTSAGNGVTGSSSAGTGTAGTGTVVTGTTGTNGNLYKSGKYTFRATLTAPVQTSASASGGTGKASASTGTEAMPWSNFFTQTGHDPLLKTADNTNDFITYLADSTSASAASASADKTSDGSFSPVENPWLSEFDGGNRTIDGVYISSRDAHSEARGLFGTIDQQCDLTIKNLKLQNFDITSSETAFADGVSTGDELITAGTLAGRVISRYHAVNIQNVVSVEDKNDYCGVWCVGTEKSAVRNGGLIGEIQTANQGTARVTVKKCSASVYVQSSVGTVDTSNNPPALKQVDIAGGLIGHIEANGGEVSVSDSYAGGHTSQAKQKPYYSSATKTRGQNGVGRNVVSYGCAGGLIGAVYVNPSGKVSLANDYSTASAACASDKTVVKYSNAGGLIGYVSTNVNKITAQDCYSTGLVEAYNHGGVIGYIALGSNDFQEVASAFQNCRFLSGVTIDSSGKDIPAVNILTSHATDATGQKVEGTNQIQNSLYPVDYKTLSTGGGKTKAVPYDSQLQGKYPFVSSQACHYGDWPEIQEETEKKQNRLMLTYDTTSDLIAIRLTGLQSGAHKYLVMNADTRKHPGPQLGGGTELKNIVDFKGGRVDNLYSASWNDNWKSIFNIEYDSKTKIYHYELMLDNVSTKFAGFASLSSSTGSGNTKGFYYGEYIDVRITDEITSSTDLKEDQYVREEYVTNTLFEDIFDPYVVKPDTLQNGTVNLNDEAVQKSIKALKHIKTGSDGKEYIADIDYPVQTGSKQYVAVINSARHLENLRSRVSKINTQDNFTVTNAVQGCDIIWNSTTAGDITGTNHEYDAYVNELQELNKGRGGSDIYQDGAPHVHNGCILPVDIENDNELVSYNGNENGIYGLKLGYSTADSDGGKSGLFGIISGTNKKFNISNLKLFNTIYDESANLQTVGTIVAICNRDLTLNKVIIGQSGGDLSGLQMKGSIECGGMVGQANAGLEVSDCAISLEGKTLSINGGTGGAAGIAAICKGDVAIQNTTISAANIQISGSFYTGGLIGHAFSSADISGSSLEAPSVSVSNTGGNYFCGGLVATCSGGSINNCHISGLKGVASDTVISITAVASNSGTNQTGGLVGNVSGNSAFTMSNSWLGADLATVSNLGSTAPAGGLIGEVVSTDFTLENSYVCGANARVMSGSNNQSAVGGLIGEIKVNTGSCSISNDYFSGYVYGPQAQYAGGLIGWIEAGNSENNYASITNCYVSGRTYNGEFPQNSAYLMSLGNGTGYSRFSMPEDQGQLQSKPIDSVIGFGTVGGLIGRYESGYLKISYSFTTTSVASLYSYQYDGGCAGGLIGSTAGTLELDNSYAVSTVESNGSKFVALGSFIAKDDDVDETKINESCYVIKELNSEPVRPVGQPDNQLNITNLSVSYLNVGNLLRNVQTTNNTETVFRDDFLKTSCPNGYPYLIWTTTTGTGNNHFDGCWVNLNSVKLTIKLSDQDVYLTVNDTHTIVATIEPQGESTGTVKWDSSNENIVTVDENGVVTGVVPGDATITASIGNSSSATCTVHVAGIKKSDDTFVTNDPVFLTPGTSAQLSMAEIPDDATVTWTVDADDKADWLKLFNGSTKTVTVNIGESAKAGQETQITATATFNNITVTAKVQVTVMVTDSGSTDNPAEEQDGGESIKSSSPDS